MGRNGENPAVIPADDERDRVKNEFLSRMSHELRTPINAILGLTRMAAESRDPEQVGRCLSQIEKSALHLLELVNDTLDMSRLDMGEMELAREQFSMAELLDKILPPFFRQAAEKRRVMSVTLLAGLPLSLVGDAGHVGQIISNLLSNAFKFTFDGGHIALEVKQLSRENGVSEIEISVTDDGIGIHPEKQTAIFLPFEQGDGSISRKHGGTGLGLAICRSLARMMGGDIAVESRPGEGSRFRCEIMLESGEECLSQTAAIAPAGIYAVVPPAPSSAAPERCPRPVRPVPDEEISLYVDMPGALARVKGNRTVYRALLSGFLRNTYYSQIRIELEHDDTRSALRTLCALKGLAENLSFPAVCEEAAAAEVRIRGGIGVDEAIDRLGEALEKTRICVDRVLDSL